MRRGDTSDHLDDSDLGSTAGCGEGRAKRRSSSERSDGRKKAGMTAVGVVSDGGTVMEGVVGDTLRIKPAEGMERSADGHVPHTLYEVLYADGDGPNHDDYARAPTPLPSHGDRDRERHGAAVAGSCSTDSFAECRAAVNDTSRKMYFPLQMSNFASVPTAVPSLAEIKTASKPQQPVSHHPSWPVLECLEVSGDFYRLRIPVLIHPEVYFVVDYAICLALKFKEKRIARYVAILANSANLRYRSMVQPKVQLSVVGITVTKKPSDEPYMVKASGYEATKNVIYGETIRKFMDYVALQAYFATSDIIFLLTGMNMSRWENNNLIGNCGGFAYLAGACTKWRVGMTEERAGSYYGVFVLAHELAHSLGCVHDGQGADSWPAGHIGSADCPYENGYMMSYKFKTPYMYKFSSCCQREVLNVYNRPTYECLIVKNSITTTIYSSKLPGEVSSLTTYCKQVYRSYTYVTADKKYSMKQCIVKCYINQNGDNMLIGAVDGVHCDKRKVCVLGNCTYKPTIDKAE
ncbi:uncharacterized protein LOC119381996 [Rhipicephalus sanguineus]|uniref:uncharacterized protein LOC119381996 n=1 Tax=Rhipicephalus sanguineus TaxID=34632 RepID=UPI0018930DAB|nr:uncharacterized protein LOC119381996 [Rhipicephalus sanguineus]